jgi:hypothetical protein
MTPGHLGTCTWKCYSITTAISIAAGLWVGGREIKIDLDLFVHPALTKKTAGLPSFYDEKEGKMY